MRRPDILNRSGERGFDSWRWKGRADPESARCRRTPRPYTSSGCGSRECRTLVESFRSHPDRSECRRRSGMSRVKVLVVDDSALMRKLIPQMLESDSSIEVVGTAMDGTFCLKKIGELQPNVVTLDLQMPGMNGIDTIKEIMRRHPLPVIVVSSHSTEGASVTLKALGLGAFDFVTKPRDSSHLAEMAAELIAKIKAAASGKIVRPGTLPAALARPEKILVSKFTPPPSKLVAIGISTGGPQALEFLLAQLPADFPGAIVVVQHMPEGFTEMFARRLDEICSLRVKEAKSGDPLQAGCVLICPGSRHIKVKRLARGDCVILNPDER